MPDTCAPNIYSNFQKIPTDYFPTVAPCLFCDTVSVDFVTTHAGTVCTICLEVCVEFVLRELRPVKLPRNVRDAFYVGPAPKRRKRRARKRRAAA